jgi:hypothetical protein
MVHMLISKHIFTTISHMYACMYNKHYIAVFMMGPMYVYHGTMLSMYVVLSNLVVSSKS